MKRFTQILALLVVTAITLQAQSTIVPQKGSDIKITIYNGDRAFINDKRSVDIDEGKQKLVYEGVPSSVITQSVVPTFSNISTTLYSQNYVYDLVSLESMLNKSIDKEVKFYTNGKEPTLSNGTLLSSEPVMIRDSKSGEIYTLEKPTQVIFPSVPSNMITKPSLVWNLDAKDSGEIGIDLKYLTRGITWKSDYVLNLQKEKLDLTGWITIKNDSGTGYENAQITCLAGEVNTVKRERRRMLRKSKNMVMDEATMSSPAVAEESFSGYHIYKIPFRETIGDNEQKQISFIDQKDIPYHQYGKNVNNSFDNYGERSLSFDNIIELENSKENHMGIPLPQGIVRMYQKDSSGETHFVGEQHVKNIPENEKVKLTIGKLFDIAGEKKITKFKANKHYRNVETTYTLRNQGKEAIELKIEERIPSYGNNIKVKTSCSDICSVEKKTAFYREFTIMLKAKEKYSFTTELEATY